MKTSYKKGQWEIYCDPQGVHIGVQDDLGFGAVCHMRDRLDIDHANARLIAAAPDMLEALERVIKWHESDCDISRKTLLNIEAIIAKAKGE